MPQYLTQAWLDRQRELLADVAEQPGATATIVHVVTGAPDGEVRYLSEYVDGRLVRNELLDSAGAGAGTVPDGDPVVTLTTPYAEAVAIAEGRLDPNAAFIAGLTKTAGPTGPLLGVLAALQSDDHRSAAADLAAETDT